MGLGKHHIGVIASSFFAGGTWTNLTNWWKFTELSGSFQDSHSSTTATKSSTASYSSIGVVLDGSLAEVYLSIAAKGTSDFTMIMRINPTSGYGDRVILGQGSGAFQLAYDTLFGLIAAQEGGSEATATTLTMTSNQVNMIAIVRSGSTFRFFINGSFESETFSATFNNASQSLGDGTSPYDSQAAGTFRDFAIFSDAKSDAYITAFYNSGSYTDYEDGDPI